MRRSLFETVADRTLHRIDGISTLVPISRPPIRGGWPEGPGGVRAFRAYRFGEDTRSLTLPLRGLTPPQPLP